MPSEFFDYVNCHDCGDSAPDHEMSYCDCGSYTCSDCQTWGESCCSRRDEDHYYHPGIHSYSHKPAWRAKGNPSQVSMGIELEVGGDHNDIISAVKAIDKREDHLFLKYDCSISGAEIVSHPMTLEWARQYRFDTMLTHLRDSDCFGQAGAQERGMYSSDGDPMEYGLHIHINRAAFLPSMHSRSSDRYRYNRHAMAWLLFLTRNRTALERLARRRADTYAPFIRPVRGELKRKSRQLACSGSNGRYEAINCGNSETYEMRFFASTVDTTEFHAAMEFADASVNYTRSLPASDILRNNALQWDAFIEWTAAQRYPHLLSEIA